MPREEVLGGPQGKITAEFPILERRRLRKPELFSQQMGTLRIVTYADPSFNVNRITNSFSPVELLSLSLGKEVVDLYAGDVNSFNNDSDRMLALQNMLRNVFSTATESQIAAFKSVLDGFGDDAAQGGDARKGYNFTSQPAGYDKRLAEFQLRYNPNTLIPLIQYDGRQYHKKDITQNGHVRHHLVLPKSLAISNIDSLTKLISDRQRNTEKVLEDISKPVEKPKEPPQGQKPKDTSAGWGDVINSLFGLPDKRSSSRDDPHSFSDRRWGGVPERVDGVKNEPQKSTRKLADQRGMSPQVIRMAERVVDQIALSKDPKSDYVAMGGDVRIGFTLSGPTGTGKTSLVEAIAGESGGYYVEILGTDILTPWQHQSGINLANKLNSITSKFFKKHKGETLFFVINEADALFPDRAGLKGAGGEDSKAEFVGEALALVEKIKRENVDNALILCLTTNLKHLDPAMQGRIGPNIEVNRPDMNGRAEIFSKYLAECLVKAKGKKGIFPEDLEKAVTSYESAFAKHPSKEVLQPYIAQLVKLLQPILTKCQDKKLAGREIEDIVKRSYNDYLIDLSKRQTNGRTIQDYILEMTEIWNPNEEEPHKKVGF